MPAIITIRRGNLRRVYNGSMSRYIRMPKFYANVSAAFELGRYDYVQWIGDRTYCNSSQKGKLLSQERIYIRRKDMKIASKKSQEIFFNNLGMEVRWTR